MNIYIIRHGETPFNVGEVRIRGRTDVPLSELGLKHADETGKALSDIPIDIIYYSKLSRAADTAKAIKKYQEKAEIFEEPLLIDFSFGDWEGKKGDEVFVDGLKEKWMTNPNEVIIPNGETFYQVFDRLHRLFMRLRDQKEDNIVLVSHGAVINLIFVYLTETHASHYWNFYADPCSITMIKFHSNGQFNLIKFNDTHHLSKEE